MAFYVGSVRQWHWISSAVCLLGMLLFAITGITLNHAAQISVEPQVHSIELQLPETILHSMTRPDEDKAPLPGDLKNWLNAALDIQIGGRDAEWSDEEIYVSLPHVLEP